MKHGSLFSGGGGFDLAADWMGWDNVFHCEINPFGKQVLKYYWPNAVSYENIITTDFTLWRGKVDIITGGFPCQPFSHAGKRNGTDDNRYLWPEMLRAIRESQPSWVVAENVPGILSIERGLVFETVCADLETEGYEVQPVIIPSCAIGADHRRDRVWFVAYSNATGQWGDKWEGQNEKSNESFKNTKCNGWANEGDKENPSIRKQRNLSAGDGKRICDEQDVAHANNERLEKRKSISRNNGQERQASVRNTRGEHWFEAATRLCRMDDGFPGRLDGITLSKWRTESLKLYGNAVDPEVVYEIFKAIQSTT